MSNKTEIMLGPSASKEGIHMIARYEDDKVEILLIESDKARFLSIPTIEQYTSRISELEAETDSLRKSLRDSERLRTLEEINNQKLRGDFSDYTQDYQRRQSETINGLYDHIKKLEAENKRLREEIENQQIEIVKKDEQLDSHRWIPVTERLPETSYDFAEQVIGLSSVPGAEVPYVVICVAFYDGHFYALETFSEIDFSKPLDVVEHQIKTITHWQPLPQPPKEQ